MSKWAVIKSIDFLTHRHCPKNDNSQWVSFDWFLIEFKSTESMSPDYFTSKSRTAFRLIRTGQCKWRILVTALNVAHPASNSLILLTTILGTDSNRQQIFGREKETKRKEIMCVFHRLLIAPRCDDRSVRASSNKRSMSANEATDRPSRATSMRSISSGPVSFWLCIALEVSGGSLFWRMLRALWGSSGKANRIRAQLEPSFPILS